MKSDGLTKPKSIEDHSKFQSDLNMTTKERAVRYGTVSVMGTDEVAELEPELQGNAPKWKDIWRID